MVTTTEPIAENSARVDVGLMLEASRNRDSGQGVFPRIPDHSPAAPRFEHITLSPTATLYSFTIIHPNPKSGLPPFVLVYADFPERVRVFGRLDLPDDVPPRIGMPLRVVEAAPDTSGTVEGYRFVSAKDRAA